VSSISQSKLKLTSQIYKASAGTGKTHELTLNILRLLLLGVHPSNILATTFTVKAAHEIKERLFLKFAKLVDQVLSENSSINSICNEYKITNSTITPAHIPEFFLKLCREQHRIRITTLDSLFVSTAKFFTDELGFSLQWSLLDTREEEQFYNEVLLRTLKSLNNEELHSVMSYLYADNRSYSLLANIKKYIHEASHLERYSSKEAWSMTHRWKRLTPDELSVAAENCLNFQCPKTKKGEDNKHFKKRIYKLVEAIRRGDSATVLADTFCEELFNASYSVISQNTASSFQNISSNESSPSDEKYQISEEFKKTLASLYEHALCTSVESFLRINNGVYALSLSFNALYHQLCVERNQLRFADIKYLLFSSFFSDNEFTSEFITSLYYRLDTRFNHIFLDEFQDTSIEEWNILLPLIEENLARQQDDRSLFCVGDIKQSIYGWRGGEPEIFNALKKRWDYLEERTSSASRRCAKAIIDFVNTIFLELINVPKLSPYHQVINTWCQNFQPHTSLNEYDGFVGLYTVSAKDYCKEATKEQSSYNNEPPSNPENSLSYNATASLAASLFKKYPGCSIGILLRENKNTKKYAEAIVRCGLYEYLSEEAKERISSDPMVQGYLNLISFIYYPHELLLRYYISNTPLNRIAELNDIYCEHEAEERAFRLRREILIDGIYSFTLNAASKLGPFLTADQQLTFDRLLILVGEYPKERFLNCESFLHFIRKGEMVKKESDARIKIMTIHSSKGLEFDVVIAPELDIPIVSFNNRQQFIVQKHTETFLPEKIFLTPQKALYTNEPELQAIYSKSQNSKLSEALSLLYVLITRARYAFYGLIDTQNRSKDQLTYAAIFEALFREKYNETLKFAKGDTDQNHDFLQPLFECGSTDFTIPELQKFYDSEKKVDAVQSAPVSLHDKPSPQCVVGDPSSQSIRCFNIIATTKLKKLLERENSLYLNPSKVYLGKMTVMLLSTIEWIEHWEYKKSKSIVKNFFGIDDQYDDFFDSFTEKLSYDPFIHYLSIGSFKKNILQPEYFSTRMNELHNFHITLFREKNFTVKLENSLVQGKFDRLIIVHTDNEINLKNQELKLHDIKSDTILCAYIVDYQKIHQVKSDNDQSEFFSPYQKASVDALSSILSLDTEKIYFKSIPVL
jgi:ATP-dependent helicase/nuclease subunit A